MFQRILVPLDLAQKNQPALAAAAEMARQHKATILLLHIVFGLEDLRKLIARTQQYRSCRLPED